MAEYYVEWTETRKRFARIQAPPNDERVLAAATTVAVSPTNQMADRPTIVDWAINDLQAETLRTPDGKPDVTFNVTLIGKVVDVPCGKNLVEQRIVPL